MLKRIKNFALTIGIFSMIVAPFSFTAAVYAASATGDSTIDNSLTCGSNLNISANCNDTATTAAKGESVNDILSLVINVFSLIVGFIAVLMIIYGGIKYITSGGESGNITGAKNTIVYAIVGLVIVALAQVLVHFVLSKVANAGTGNGA